MATELTSEPGLSAGERKKLLIAQGRLYRLGMLESGQKIASGLRMEAWRRLPSGIWPSMAMPCSGKP